MIQQLVENGSRIGRGQHVAGIDPKARAGTERPERRVEQHGGTPPSDHHSVAFPGSFDHGDDRQRRNFIERRDHNDIADRFPRDRDAAASASRARRAAMAHAVYSPEVRHPVEVGAAEQDHLVRWLSKRLGANIKAPLLQALGYELVGGRLLPGENGPVAHFMYQDGRGQRLTLYVSTRKGDPRDTAFRFSQEGRVAVFYWIDANLGYALSSELDKATLLKVATSVYQQLNP